MHSCIIPLISIKILPGGEVLILEIEFLVAAIIFWETNFQQKHIKRKRTSLV